MLYPSENINKELLIDLKKTLKSYNPYDVFRRNNSEIYEKILDLGMFNSKWPDAYHSKIFLHHLESMELNSGLIRDAFLKKKKSKYSNKNVTFFIRSYAGDFCWLRNLLESITSFANNASIVICVEESDLEALPSFSMERIKVVTEKSFCPGTIQQKYSKLTADFHCNTEFIIYLDSDSALVKPFDINDWLFDDKPVLEYTSYNDINNWFKQNNLKDGNPEVWRKGVSRAIGYLVDNEFSRRLEKIYKREWLKGMREIIEVNHGINFKDFMAAQKGTKSTGDNLNAHYFSDFNYMGAYLWKYKHDEVAWLNTSVLDFWTRQLCAVQFHSYTMTKKINGVKVINEIPEKFMRQVYSFWRENHGSESYILELYKELRNENRY